MLLLMDYGNALFGGASDMSEASQLQAFFEYIHIHTAPLDAITSATPEQIRADSRKLAMSISFTDLSEFTDQFSASRERLAAASVSILPDKDTPPGKQEQSPTGSPATSTLSEPMQILPENITSFGPCPSSEVSNTSMPPTSPPDRSADGPFPVPAALPVSPVEDWMLE
jgi:hypothetical protein